MASPRHTVVVLLSLLCLSPATSTGQGSLVVGSNEGEGMLFYPRQVEEGPDGNIYVFDTGDAYIKVYSPEGEYLRRIGGEGEGPGEFQRADGSAFGFLPDGRLYFTEFFGGHRWITVMELSGDFYDVSPLDLDEAFGIRYAHPLDDGGFLVHLSLSSAPEKVSDYYLYSQPEALVRIDSKGTILSEIIRTEYVTMISMVPDGATTNLPFHPIFAWVPLEEGAVAYADGMSGILKVLDYRGNLIREIETELPGSTPVTKDELEEWKHAREERMLARNPSWYNRFGKVIHKYEKSLYDKPGFAGVSLTPGGHILVGGLWDPEEEKRDYWLIDGEGATLVKAAIGLRSLGFSDRYVLYMTFGDGGPAVHCVERTGDERADLLMMR